MGKKKTAEDYNQEYVGKVYGYSRIDEYSHKDKNRKPYFWCTCLRCGKKFGPVELGNLKSGRSTSCGHCLERAEIGKRYSHYVVREYHHRDKKSRLYFLCDCDCGNDGVVMLQNLKSGHTTSCGHCLERTEIGKRYGHYVVREFLYKCENGRLYFLCECDCGNEEVIRLDSLKTGNTTSCGCRTESIGEEKIRMMLEELEVKFEQEYTGFTDMKDKKVLRCDFWLPGFNRVIEFDGPQHFEVVDTFDGEEGFKDTQRRDQIKNQYCWEHGIDIVRIPYWEIDNINYNDLVDKYSKYLVKEKKDD